MGDSWAPLQRRMHRNMHMGKQASASAIVARPAFSGFVGAPWLREHG